MKANTIRIDQNTAESTPLSKTGEEERHVDLRVEWPDDRRTIEDAVRELPESSDWPGVFNVLLELRGAEKRVAVVLDRKDPVAVVLLRPATRSSWELATNWIVPGFLFPVRPGCIYASLAALKVPVHVGWWRSPEPPPLGPRTYDLKETPTHRMDCTTDLDIYWQQSGNINFLRQARRKCKNFTIRLNPPQGFEWVNRNWERKWRTDSQHAFKELEDRVAVAKVLEASGRHNTFVLFEGDTPIAGATLLVHNNCLVAQVNYRLSEYDRYGTGNYLLEEIFRWAVRSGLREFDLGGGVAYKQLWAPVAGYKYEFTVCPMWTYWMQTFATRLKRKAGSFLPLHAR